MGRSRDRERPLGCTLPAALMLVVGTQVLELSSSDSELLRRRYTLAWTGHWLQQRALWVSPMPLADAL